MKKLISVILSLFLTVGIAVSVSGCDKTDELESKLASLEAQIAKQTQEIANLQAESEDLQAENDKLQADLAKNEEKYKDYHYEEAPSGLYELEKAYESGGNWQRWLGNCVSNGVIQEWPSDGAVVP